MSKLPWRKPRKRSGPPALYVTPSPGWETVTSNTLAGESNVMVNSHRSTTLATDPMAGSPWDRDDISWAFPGFHRQELEGIVNDILSSRVGVYPLEKVYLSGPMKGYKFNNFPKFEEIALILRRRFELQVISPHEIAHDGENLSPQDYLRGDLIDMMKYCRGIVMMGNWLQSWGACFELNVAAKLGYAIYLYNEKNLTIHDGERLRYYVR